MLVDYITWYYSMHRETFMLFYYNHLRNSYTPTRDVYNIKEKYLFIYALQFLRAEPFKNEYYILKT